MTNVSVDRVRVDVAPDLAEITGELKDSHLGLRKRIGGMDGDERLKLWGTLGKSGKLQIFSMAKSTNVSS